VSGRAERAWDSAILQGPARVASIATGSCTDDRLLVDLLVGAADQVGGTSRGSADNPRAFTTAADQPFGNILL
jgi:hypothetical protein